LSEVVLSFLLVENSQLPDSEKNRKEGQLILLNTLLNALFFEERAIVD